MILNNIQKAFQKLFIDDSLLKTIINVGEEANMKCYLVGGFIRDAILNRSSKDIDFSVVGDCIDFAQRVAKKLGAQTTTFKTFGTCMLKYQNVGIEFVSARKESYNHHSRNPQVERGTLEDDLLRRDFTINALALSLNSENFGELIDPFNGLADIDNSLIRTPIDVHKTFSDDPLRMMRAIRFATQLGFSIEEHTFRGIKENHHRLHIVSAERIVDELNKIILSKVPSYGFNLLDQSKLLDIILPEFTKLKGTETKNGRSHKDNYLHTLEVLDNIAKVSDDVWLRWSAILHDIAKPQTKRFSKKSGWTFHGHEDKGARMVPKIFKRLKLPMNEKMHFVKKMVALHLRPIALVNEKVTDSAIRRLLFDAGDDIDALMTLCKADITTKSEFKKNKYRHNFDLVKTKLEEVEERDKIRNWQPPISGEEIMNALNIPPSREVGIVKNEIKEAILEGIISNDPKSAKAYMYKIAEKLNMHPLV